MALVLLYQRRSRKLIRKFQPPYPCGCFEASICEPFSVGNYLERIDRELVDLLSTHGSEKTPEILWWGLDGLRLKEDGTTEWISRKKPKPDRMSFPQPAPSEFAGLPSQWFSFQTAQCTRDTLDRLRMENTCIRNSLLIQQLSQTCCTQIVPSYLRGTQCLYADNQYAAANHENCRFTPIPSKGGDK